MRKYEEKTHSALSNCSRVLFDFFILFTFQRVLFSAFASSSSSSYSYSHDFFSFESAFIFARSLYLLFICLFRPSPSSMEWKVVFFILHYHSLWQPPHESWIQIAMATATAVEATVRVELTLNSIKRTFRKRNCGFFFYSLSLALVSFFYHWY